MAFLNWTSKMSVGVTTLYGDHKKIKGAVCTLLAVHSL